MAVISRARFCAKIAVVATFASFATVAPSVGPAVAQASTGTLYSWGTFFPKVATSFDSPQVIGGVPGTIVQISGSDRDMYALTARGTVWSWGAEGHGALGNGTTGTGVVTKAVRVRFPAGVSIKSLPTQLPQNTGMAIDRNGNVWGWGGGGGGALCSTWNDKALPQEVTAPELQADVTLASGQNNHAIYYTSTGLLYGCGHNTAGELGDGSFTSSDSPVQVVGLPAEPVTSVQTSWENSGVLLADGSYWDWGYNHRGQLGDGSTSPSDVPAEVSLPATVTTVSEGGSLGDNGQTLVVLADQSAFTWGSDSYGQLGIGSGHPRYEALPVEIAVPAGTTFVSVASGAASEYAIDSTGNVWAWGQNNYGQLGIGNTRGQSLPVSVGVSASQVVSIAQDVAARAG